MATSEAVERALLAAAARIVDKRPTIAAAELTVTNVALEAGVSRATAYRCRALKDLIAVRTAADPDDDILPAATKPRQSGEKELRAALAVMLNRIVYLEAALRERDRIIADQRERLMKLNL